MVTFSCDKCQWSGTKAKVEKHYNRCGGEFFSCIDCGKSFAEDYAQHTSCVQEDDKYHGKWAKAKQGNAAKLPAPPTQQVANGVSNGMSNGSAAKRKAKKKKNKKKKKKAMNQPLRTSPNGDIVYPKDMNKRQREKWLTKKLMAELKPMYGGPVETYGPPPTINGASNVSENDKKRKRDDEVNDDEKSPPSKKAKLDTVVHEEGEESSSADHPMSMSTEKQLKKLKKILKEEGTEPLLLKDACSKFNEAVGIEDSGYSKLFFERLWDLRKKAKLSY